MFRYSAFAGVLHSELEFPELAPSTTEQATWTVRVSDDESSPAATENEMGIDEVEPGVPVRLLQRPDSWVLRYADVGDYIIHPGTHTYASEAPALIVKFFKQHALP